MADAAISCVFDQPHPGSKIGLRFRDQFLGTWLLSRTGNNDCNHRAGMAPAIPTRNHRAGIDAPAIPTHWQHGRNHRAGMDALAFARTGNVDVIIVRAWMLWPFARTGNKQGGCFPGASHILRFASAQGTDIQLALACVRPQGL